MRKNKLAMRAVVSCFLAFVLMMTNMPVFGAAQASDSVNPASGTGVITASLPDDAGNPVDISLSIPTRFDTETQAELVIALDLTVNISNVTGLNVTIPMASPDGTRYFGYNLIMEGIELPDPVTGITYTGSALTIHFQDDLPTGTYGPINFSFPFIGASESVIDDTVLWDTEGVIVSTNTPGFNAALPGVAVMPMTWKGSEDDSGIADEINYSASFRVADNNSYFLDIECTPTWTEGTAENVELHINLPYFRVVQQTDGSRVYKVTDVKTDYSIAVSSIEAEGWEYDDSVLIHTDELVLTRPVMEAGSVYKVSLQLKPQGSVTAELDGDIAIWMSYSSFGGEESIYWSEELTPRLVTVSLPATILNNEIVRNPYTISLGASFMEEVDSDVGDTGDPKMRVVRTGETIYVTVTATPSWSDDTIADFVKIHINLPFVSTDGIEVSDNTGMGVLCVPNITVDDNSGWYLDLGQWGGEAPSLYQFTGTELIVTTPMMAAGTQPSFTMGLQFFGAVPENSMVSINGWVEYSSLNHDENTSSWYTPGMLDPDSEVRLICSNLIWDASIASVTATPTDPENPLSVPRNATIIWDRFNYAAFEIEIDNISISAVPTVNGFSFNFNTPFQSMNPYGGVIDVDMKMWPWGTAGDEFIGIPGKGGVLVYDITDLGPDDPYGDPLPYIYTGTGQFTVLFRDCPLYSPVAAAANPDLITGKKLRIEIPFPNMFTQLPANLNLAIIPTVTFGDVNNPFQLSKNRNSDFECIGPDLQEFTFSKTPQDGDVYYYGYGSYYIGDIKSHADIPYFGTCIIDTVSEYFEIANIRYILDDDGTGTADISDAFLTGVPAQYEITVTDLTDGTTKTEWYDLPDFIALGSDGIRYTWEISGVTGIINAMLDSLTDDLHEAVYTNRVKFNLKDRIECYERIPGRIQIEGFLNNKGPLTNKADMYWFYQWDQSEITTANKEPVYVQRLYGPVKKTAVLNVIGPKPLLTIDGYSAMDGSLGSPIWPVLYNFVNGYRYYPGNSNGASMGPAELSMTLPVSGDSTAPKGFLLDNIFLSEALLKVCKIKKIEFTDAFIMDPVTLKPIVVTLDYSGVNITGGGALTIPASSWNSALSAARKTANSKLFPSKVVVYVTLYDNILIDPGVAAPSDNGIYIQLNGLTNEYGEQLSKAEWRNIFKDGYVESVSAEQTLLVVRPNPILTIDGEEGDSGRIGNNLPVQYNTTNGYRYYPGNGSEAEIYVGGSLDITLPVSGDQVNGVNGLLLDRIVISEALLKVGTIDRIELRDYFDTKGAHIVTIDGDTTGPDGNPLLLSTAAGRPVIPQSVWLPDPTAVNAVNYPVQITVYFSKYLGSFDAPEVSDPKSSDIYIDLIGVTNKYGNLVSTATWKAFLTDTTSLNAGASQTLLVVQPNPTLTIDGEECDNGNLGNNLSVPYNITNGYRYYPGNNSEAKIYVSGSLDITLPVSGDLQNGVIGLMLDQIVISEALLNIGSIDRIEIRDYFDTKGAHIVTIDGDTTDSDGNPLFLSPATGQLVIPQSVWLPDPGAVNAVNYPVQVTVYFSKYSGSLDAPEVLDPKSSDIFIDLTGVTNKYGSIVSTATWKAFLTNKTSVNANATQTLNVIDPKPQILIDAKYYNYTDGKSSESTWGYNWQQIPYGREGTFSYKLWNDSSSRVQNGTVKLDFQINSDDAGDEQHRGFKVTEITVSKQLLDVMNTNKIEITDVDFASGSGVKFTIIRGDDGNFYEAETDSEGNLIPGSLFEQDASGNYVFEKGKIGEVNYPKELVFYIDSFEPNVMYSEELYVAVKGYFDNLPYVSSNSAGKKYIPTQPNNITTAKWDYGFNNATASYVTSAGFAVMAASIDMDMFARFSLGSLGDTGYTAANARNYEYASGYETSVSNYYITENFYTQVGYKSIGSFVVLYNQENNWAKNVQMHLAAETSFPVDSFELYYLDMSPAIKPYLDKVEIYRNDASGNEYLWQTVYGDDNTSGQPSQWQSNGHKSGCFRINMLRPDNAGSPDLFHTITNDTDPAVVDTHPYYRSPDEDMMDPVERVTRVVVHLDINKNAADSNGNAIAPDFGPGVLFDYAGRFTRIGGVAARTRIVYDFGNLQDETLRADKEPNDTLVSDSAVGNAFNSNAYTTKYVAAMMDGDRYDSAGLSGPGNHYGTSDTQTNFQVVPASILTRKDGTDPLVGNSGNNSLNTLPDVVFGENSTFSINFAIQPSTSASAWDNTNEWSGRYSYADIVQLTDTLPIPAQVIGYANPYEGYLTRRIYMTNPAYVNPDKFLYLKVDMTDGSSYTYTLDDFADTDGVPGTIEIGFNYAWDTASSSAVTVISPPDGVFPKSFEIAVKNFFGDGDRSAELLGYSRSTYTNDADLKIDGDVLCTEYSHSLNMVVGTVKTSDGATVGSTCTASARVKAYAKVLLGKLTVTANHGGNTFGENQWVYNPRPQPPLNDPEALDTPNIMEYYFNMYNPKKTATIGKAPIGKFEVSSGALPTGYRLEDIVIPSALFDGDIENGENWYVSSFKITTPKNSNVEIKDYFKDDGAGNYSVHIRDLFGSVLTMPVPDAAGYVSYTINSFSAVLEVRDATYRLTYLYVADDAASDAALLDRNNITLRGVYAETTADKADGQWDADSRATIATTSFSYRDSRSINATLKAYSNDKYTNPSTVASSTATWSGTISSLIAPLLTAESRTQVYDVHDNTIYIDKGMVMPGDRVNAVVTFTNTGDPSNFNDGFTYLKDPLLRYSLAAGIQVVSWSLDTDNTTADDFLTADNIVCMDTSVTSSPKTVPENTVPSVKAAPYTKDLTWYFRDGILDEGEKIVINLILEFTDELGIGTAYPTVYQNKSIANTGRIWVSGAPDHGFRPVCVGDRDATSPPAYYSRGLYCLDPSVSSLASITAGCMVHNLYGAWESASYLYGFVNTTAPTVVTNSDTSFGGLPDNITTYASSIVVGNLANYTYHEVTGHAVEIVFDTGVKKLQGFILTAWPDIRYPDGFTGEYDRPQVYYMNLNTDGSLSDWILVPDTSEEIPAGVNVYAMRWDYGALPDRFNNKLITFPNVVFKGDLIWRSAGPDPTADPATTYTINTGVDTFYYHNLHGYADRFAGNITGNYYNGNTIAGSTMAIGNTSATSYTVVKEVPFVEIDSQVFANEPAAKAPYAPFTNSQNAGYDENRKVTYRPGDEFWYKITVKNRIRDNSYLSTGTGPLLNPVIIDKVPEYIVMRPDMQPGPVTGDTSFVLDITGALASGDLDIAWYTQDGSKKTLWNSDSGEFNPETQFKAPIVTVETRTGPDTGGAQMITGYQSSAAPAYKSNLALGDVKTIEFTVYKYDFKGQKLARGERLEIQYRANARTDELPINAASISVENIVNGEISVTDENVSPYLPRYGEYEHIAYNAGTGRRVYPESGVTSSQPMDGDYLIHESGVSGTPNPGTPPNSFLNSSLTWIPGHNSGDDYSGTYVTGGSNGNLFDYDFQAVRTQQVEFKSDANRVQSYTNTIYNGYKVTQSKDIYLQVLEPRVSGFRDFNEGLNIVWTQNRMHLTKAWLYGASQMISAQKYEDDANTYNSSNNYSTYGTYTKDANTYGVEFDEVFTARQLAVNYGDAQLDGVEFIYVLPRGTEPVGGSDLTISGWYGDPHTGPTVAIDPQYISYEILQKPDDAAGYKAPFALMEGRDKAPGNNGSYYDESYINDTPWVIRITVKQPLTEWWYRDHTSGAAGTAGTAATYYIFTEFKATVVDENANGRWYDELYTTPVESEISRYCQVYSYDFVWGNTRPDSGKYDAYYSGGTFLYVPDAGHTGMMTGTGDYNFYTSKTGDVFNYSLYFYSPQTPYIRGLNYQGQRLRIDGRLYMKNGDMMKARMSTPRLSAVLSGDYHDTREKAPFTMSIHLSNQYWWADNPRAVTRGYDLPSDDKYVHSHDTDGGLQGTIIEPVIADILPYGIVPVDTDGNPLPGDGVGWVDDGSRLVDYSLSGLGLSGDDLDSFRDKWILKTEFMETDGDGNELYRYKLTWIPKDPATTDDHVRLAYGEQIDVDLTVKTIYWPENTYVDGNGLTVQDPDLNSRWQLNRVYATSKRSKFFFFTEMAGAPSGYAVPGLVSGHETDDINVEDYAKCAPQLLTPDEKDFNKSGANRISPDDGPVTADSFVANTVSISTTYPQLTVSKTASRDSGILSGDVPLDLSFSDVFWYHVTVQNSPGNTPAAKGSIQSSTICIYDWMPDQVSYDGEYLLTYQDPSNPAATVTKTMSESAADGWDITISVNNAEPDYDGDKRYIAFRVTTPPDFNASADADRMRGDLLSGEWFTLSMRAKITEVGDPALIFTGGSTWPDIKNTVYVNTEHFANQEVDPRTAQPTSLLRYSPSVTETPDKPVTDKDGETSAVKGQDYNDNGSAAAGKPETFTYGTSSIGIFKPKAAIREDTEQTGTLLTSGSYVSASYTGLQDMVFMLDQVGNIGAHVPEMIVVSNGLSQTAYSPRDVNPAGWLYKTMSVTTGVWEFPWLPGETEEAHAARLAQYRVYTYYTTEIIDISQLPDKSTWNTLGAENDYGLLENALIPVEISLQSNIAQIVYLIRCDMANPELDPVINTVPKGTRVAVTADPGNPTREVSDVDPPGSVYGPGGVLIPDEYKRDFVRYDNSIYTNSPRITYITEDFVTYPFLLYSSTALWARFGWKDEHVELGQTSARAYVTPSKPTVNMEISSQYFRYGSVGGVFKYSWDNNMLINPTTGKSIKYTINFYNLSKDAWGGTDAHHEDVLMDPVIVNAISSAVTVNPNDFTYIDPKDPANVMADGYTSTMDIKKGEAKWTWELIKANPNGLGKLEFDADNFYIGNVQGYNKTTIRWPFKGNMEPGDILRLTFIGTANDVNYDPGLMSDTVYGFNQTGTMEMYYDPETVINIPAVDIDRLDLNQNGFKNDRYISVDLPPFTFFSTQNYLKQKFSFSDLYLSGSSTDPVPATEGSVYSFMAEVTNPQDPNVAGTDYMYPIMFDLLHYPGDTQAIGSRVLTTDPYVANRRYSQWLGWIIPDSFVLSNGNKVISPSDYTIWVGPITGSGAAMSVGNVQTDLTDLQVRSNELYALKSADSTTGESFIRSNHFVRLDEVAALQYTYPELYEKLVKGIRFFWLQIHDRKYSLHGHSTLTLAWKMQAPLNLPFLNGNSGSNGVVSNYTAWNNFSSWYDNGIGSVTSTIGAVKPSQSNNAGVYLNAPENRVYIGDYVWLDTDYNGLQDEIPQAVDSNGRLLPAIGEPDGNGSYAPPANDPGINGVKVELLTEDGFLSDNEGRRIKYDMDGYYLIDRNGNLLLSENGLTTKVDSAQVTATVSDYANRKGYYILTNLVPDRQYRLKFTFPEEYKYYGVTTNRVHAGNTEVQAYNAGMTLPGFYSDSGSVADTLVVYTELFTPVTGQPDSYYTDFDIGVNLPLDIGGKAWNDSTVGLSSGFRRNGICEEGELPIPGATIVLRRSDTGEVARTMLNTDAVATSGEDGTFLIHGVLPSTEYYFTAVSNDINLFYPTLTRPSLNVFTDPGGSRRKATVYNDLYYDDVGPVNLTDTFVPDSAVEFDSHADQIKYLAVETFGFGFMSVDKDLITGTVWIDANRDGFMDIYEGSTDENGLEGMAVCLRRYTLDSDGQRVDDSGYGVVTSYTDNVGVYFFDELEAYGAVMSEDGTAIVKTPYYYEVYLEELPEGYIPTVYNAWNNPEYEDGFLAKTPLPAEIYRNGLDSSLDKATGIIATGIKFDQDTATGAKRAPTTGVNAGLAEISRGRLWGYVWDDAEKEGFYKEGAAIGEPEYGIAAVTVYLRRYALKPGETQWTVDGDFGADGAVSTVSDTDGYYSFDNLDSMLPENNPGRGLGTGNTVYSYELFITDAPMDYTPTLYHSWIGDATKYGTESDMDRRTGYITPLEQDSAGTGRLISTAVPLDDGTTGQLIFLARQNADDEYDPLLNAASHKANAGFTLYATGGISGIVWKNQNADGYIHFNVPAGATSAMTGAPLMNEEPITGLIIFLECYDPETDEFKKVKEITSNMAVEFDDGSGVYITDTSGPGGEYTFDSLPTVDPITKMPYVYRISSEIPSFYSLTVRPDEADPADNDLDNTFFNDSGDITYCYSYEYTLVAPLSPDEAVSGKSVNRFGEDYNLAGAVDHENVDLGLIPPIPNNTIKGYIWQDKERDGVMHDEDATLERIVYLYKYNYHAEKWEEFSDLHSRRYYVTGDDGYYEFEVEPLNIDIRDTELLLMPNQYQLVFQKGTEESFSIYLSGLADENEVDSEELTEKVSYVRDDISEPSSGITELVRDLGWTSGDCDNLGFTGILTFWGDSAPTDAMTDVSVLKTLEPLVRPAGITPPQGSVSGYLWQDDDGDGVMNAAETLVSGAAVRLRRYVLMPDNADWDLDEDYSAETVTDEYGYYEFDALPAEYGYKGSEAENMYARYGYVVYIEEDIFGSLPDRYTYTISMFEDAGSESNLLYSGILADTDPDNAGLPSPFVFLTGDETDYGIGAAEEESFSAPTRRAVQLNGGFAPFKTAEISGMAWKDVNHDGIRQDSEPMVPKMPVTLHIKDTDGDFGNVKTITDVTGAVTLVFPWDSGYDGYLPDVYTVETDDGGVYAFTDLPLTGAPGDDPYNYRVVAEKTEYADFTAPNAGTDAPHVLGYVLRYGENPFANPERDSDFVLSEQDSDTTGVSTASYQLTIGLSPTEMYDSVFGAYGGLFSDSAYPRVFGTDDYSRSYSHNNVDIGLAYPVTNISGRVWLDTEGTGRNGADAPGISDIPLTLYRKNIETQDWELYTDVFTGDYVKITGDDGGYSFTVEATEYDSEDDFFLWQYEYCVVAEKDDSEEFSPPSILELPNRETEERGDSFFFNAELLLQTAESITSPQAVKMSLDTGVDGNPNEAVAFGLDFSDFLPKDSQVASGAALLVTPGAGDLLQEDPQVASGAALLVTLSATDLRDIRDIINVDCGLIPPEPTPEPSPTPMPDVSPTPMPDVSPTPMPDVSPTPMPDVSPTPMPDVSPTPTQESSPSPTPDVSPTPTPEASPAPTPDTSPSPTPDATPSPTSNSSPSPTPEISPSPVPEPTLQTTPPDPVIPQETSGTDSTPQLDYSDNDSGDDAEPDDIPQEPKTAAPEAKGAATEAKQPETNVVPGIDGAIIPAMAVQPDETPAPEEPVPDDPVTDIPFKQFADSGIVKNLVRLTGIPITGDNIIYYIIMLLASMVGMAGVIWFAVRKAWKTRRGKKEKKKNKK